MKHTFKVYLGLLLLASGSLLTQTELSWGASSDSLSSYPKVLVPEGNDVELIPDDLAQIEELKETTRLYVQDNCDAPIISESFKTEVALAKARMEKPVKVAKHIN